MDTKNMEGSYDCVDSADGGAYGAGGYGQCETAVDTAQVSTSPLNSVETAASGSPLLAIAAIVLVLVVVVGVVIVVLRKKHEKRD